MIGTGELSCIPECRDACFGPNNKPEISIPESRWGRSVFFDDIEGPIVEGPMTVVRQLEREVVSYRSILPGVYEIVNNSGANVSEGVSIGSRDLNRVEQRQCVNVVEVQTYSSETRVRSRLDTGGWITILKYFCDNKRFANFKPKS